MQTIEQAVAQLQELLRAGDAAKVKANSFAEQVVLCGAGSPGFTRSVELEATLAAIIDYTPELSISISHFQPVDDNCCITWLQWRSPTEQDGIAEFRSLTVWQRQQQSWKILSDMYGLGHFAEL